MGGRWARWRAGGKLVWGLAIEGLGSLEMSIRAGTKKTCDEAVQMGIPGQKRRAASAF